MSIPKVGAGPRRRATRGARRGADHGIDGKIIFREDPRAVKCGQIIIQAKGGKIGVKDVGDLRGVLDHE
jgi:hypothetical protein